MLTWKYRPSAALVGAPVGASAGERAATVALRDAHIKFLDTYLLRGYQGPRYTSWRAASRLVALTEGEQGCSEADFRAVPVGAALGSADRALVARGLADLDSVVRAGVDMVGKAMAAPVSEGTGADPGLAGIASVWWSVRLPCCSMDRRTPSSSCSVFLRRPTVGLRRRKRSSNLRSGSWPVVAS